MSRHRRRSLASRWPGWSWRCSASPGSARVPTAPRRPAGAWRVSSRSGLSRPVRASPRRISGRSAPRGVGVAPPARRSGGRDRSPRCGRAGRRRAGDGRRGHRRPLRRTAVSSRCGSTMWPACPPEILPTSAETSTSRLQDGAAAPGSCSHVLVLSPARRLRLRGDSAALAGAVSGAIAAEGEGHCGSSCAETSRDDRAGRPLPRGRRRPAPRRRDDRSRRRPPGRPARRRDRAAPRGRRPPPALRRRASRRPRRTRRAGAAPARRRMRSPGRSSLPAPPASTPTAARWPRAPAPCCRSPRSLRRSATRWSRQR